MVLGCFQPQSGGKTGVTAYVGLGTPTVSVRRVCGRGQLQTGRIKDTGKVRPKANSPEIGHCLDGLVGGNGAVNAFND